MFMGMQVRVRMCFATGMSVPMRVNEIGLFQQYQMTEGLHGIAFGLLTRVAGWDPLKVEAFLAAVRREMKDPNVHSLYKL